MSALRIVVQAESQHVTNMQLMIRPSNMTQLFAICKSDRKVWRTLPNGGHNDSVAEPGYFEHILSFVREEVLADGH